MDPLVRLRLTLWYAAAVGSITIMPWMALSLADAGLDRSTAAAVMLMLPIGQLVASPGWTWVADRYGVPHLILRASTIVVACAGLLLLLSPGAAAMIAVVACWALARAPMFPLADRLTLTLLGANRRDYGRIRAVGSVVYLLMMLLTGWLRETTPRAPLWIGATLLVATALITPTLPAPPNVARPGPPLSPFALFRAAARPELLPLIGVCVLHGVTITTYDSLFSLHVQQLGLRSSLTGVAVALGVGVEVLVLTQGRRLNDRFDPRALFCLAVASGIPRWALTATAPEPWLLVLAQSLHGLGFGLFWVSGVALFSERAPAGLDSSVQSLLPASTFGAGYLVSMSVASVVLRVADTTTLFALSTGTSALATLAALAWWRAERRTPPPGAIRGGPVERPISA